VWLVEKGTCIEIMQTRDKFHGRKEVFHLNCSAEGEAFSPCVNTQAQRKTSSLPYRCAEVGEHQNHLL
jgi:hypothetical protein